MSAAGYEQSLIKVDIGAKCAPPEWALLERLLFETLNRAAVEFSRRYTRSDGTLIWRDRWAGMDGSDDPYEGFMYFPLLYALGGSEAVYKLSKKIWDSITWQWTQYGQIHDEFDGYYDWMHHGEGYLYFYFFGLADPNVLKDRQRAEKFAGLYTGDNPDVPNYDKEKKLIRSPITGSKGPRFCQTAEDWETHREILDDYLPPFEDIPGILPDATTCPWSDDHTYAEILSRINERQAKGDVPINLNCTTLMAHAYMYGGTPLYREWVFEYVHAWAERTERNDGITPDNIGLSGEIGEYMDGKWWGGYYGWRWPHGAPTIMEPLIVGCTNAVLLSGNMEYLNLARSQLDMLWNLRIERNKQWLVPTRHYDDGWRDYRLAHPMYPILLWNVSMDEQDAERAVRGWYPGYWEEVNPNYSDYNDGSNGIHMGFNGNTAQWFRYIRGQFPLYPVRILKTNYDTIRGQLERIRTSEADPMRIDHYAQSMSIHMWQDLTPMIIEGLAQLTLGGPMHAYHGGLQHARVRYFDCQLQRPGLPESVAALVERLGADSATIQLVNISLFEDKELIIQAGTFGEHQFTEVDVYSLQDEWLESAVIGSKWMHVRLQMGSGAKLIFKMKRYVHQPSYETPWKADDENQVARIFGRKVE